MKNVGKLVTELGIYLSVHHIDVNNYVIEPGDDGIFVFGRDKGHILYNVDVLFDFIKYHNLTSFVAKDGKQRVHLYIY